MPKLPLIVLLNATALIGGIARNIPAETRETAVAEQAVIRQAPHVETLLTDTPQRTATVNHVKGTKTLALESLGKTGAGMMAGPAANLAMPYAETGALKLGHVGRGLISGHGTDTKRVEFDVLPGTTAGVSVNPGKIEIVVPLNRYLLSAQSIENVRPVLLKLDVSAKDQVRIITARHIDLKQTKKNRFDLKPAVDRMEESIDETELAVSFERLAGNVYRIVNTDTLAVGEYAVVFRTKGESGHYTANVALKTTAPQVQGQSGSRTSLAEMMSGKRSSNDLATSATNFIAFDFRVLP
jgi:hypothetical protein